MPKINREEYEILKGLDDRWKWIARDEDGELSAYRSSPNRLEDGQYWVGKNVWEEYHLNIDLFQFIQWEDEEPYYIAGLISSFEEAIRINKIFERTTKMALEESEETEVKKDLGWLKEEADKQYDRMSKNYMITGNDTDNGMAMSAEIFINLIDQVEQPELPVIPDYVAEWMETVKELDTDLLNATIDGRYNVEVSEWLFIEDDEINTLNGEKLMRAWLDGYTVEEKYYVIKESHIGKTALLMKALSSIIVRARPFDDLEQPENYQFTEQEIKDYDERFWPFAVKVEELEE